MNANAVQPPQARVLVADDEEPVRVALARILRSRGYDVAVAGSVAEARGLLGEHNFAVVIADLHMPDEDGIDLLRHVRSIDAELPVILITGAPTAESAVHAVQLQATGYLTKPIDPERLIAELSRALKMRDLAKVRLRALEVTRAQAADADLERQFSAAIAGLHMVYHPVVAWKSRTVFGYEALMRTSERSLGNPVALLQAAERLGRLHDLGRAVRGRCAHAVSESPTASTMLVNLHPIDLTDPELFDPGAPLSKVASRVVLEITERAQLETVPEAESRISSLRKLGFRIAIDDIGAGYSGLNSFALLRPDLVKIDMALVRHIDTDAVKRRLASLLIQLCADLDIGVIAEGVETAKERDALLELDCQLLQGYLFARPAAPMPAPTW